MWGKGTDLSGRGRELRLESVKGKGIICGEELADKTGREPEMGNSIQMCHLFRT